MLFLDDMIRNLTRHPGPYEGQLVADALEECGRMREAEILRSGKRYARRHRGQRWWIEDRPKPMVTFEGDRVYTPSDANVRGGRVRLRREGQEAWRRLAIKPSQSIRLHSEGFEWGYAGSGPAQLALALLLYVAGKDAARQHYQAFKRAFVAKWSKDSWTLQEENVWVWLDDREDFDLDPETLTV